MTTTLFYNPTAISNVTIPNTITGYPSIDWNFNSTAITDTVEAVTQKPLHTISGLWMEKFLSNTSQLWCTQYNIPNPTTYTAYVPQVGYSYTYATGYNGITTANTPSVQINLGWDKILTLFTPNASTSDWNLSDSGQVDNAEIPFTQLNYSSLTGSLLSNTFYVIIANNAVQGFYRNGLLNLFNISSTYYALTDFNVGAGTTLYFYNVQSSTGWRHFPTTPTQIIWADSSVSLISSGYFSGPYSPGDTAGNVNLFATNLTGGKSFPATVRTTNYSPAVPSTVAYVPTILGIELELDVKRAARIEDLVVQLTLGGVLIGNNLASTINPVQADMYTAERANYPTPVPDYSIYGGGTNKWGTALTSNQIADPTFGVVISFQSNVIYPHKDLAYLHKARLRVTYA
jgi:hypothetical protein